jgi:hypothetical protein
MLSFNPLLGHLLLLVLILTLLTTWFTNASATPLACDDESAEKRKGIEEVLD